MHPDSRDITEHLIWGVRKWSIHRPAPILYFSFHLPSEQIPGVSKALHLPGGTMKSKAFCIALKPTRSTLNQGTRILRNPLLSHTVSVTRLAQAHLDFDQCYQHCRPPGGFWDFHTEKNQYFSSFVLAPRRGFCPKENLNVLELTTAFILIRLIKHSLTKMDFYI